MLFMPVCLYGSAHRRHNPGEDQHIDRAGARPQQRARAGIYRRARGEHVVDKNKPAPGHLGLALRRYPEGALHVLCPFRLAEADLVRRGPDAPQRAMQHRPSARLGDDLAELRRLVEAPRPLPAPVQRHRDDGVGLGEQFAAGIGHPAPHHRGEVEPVAVFEGVHELLGDVVVADRGPRPLVGRRIGDCRGREPTRSIVWWSVLEREGGAEPGAIRRRDEAKLAPASRAQAGAVHGLAAGGAVLRQRHVGHEPQRGPQHVGQSAKTPDRDLARSQLPLHDVSVPSGAANLNSALGPTSQLLLLC